MQRASSGFVAPLPGLVAPYVHVHDYYSLCLVQKSFYAIFAPLLFKDPLVMVASLGKYDLNQGESGIDRA